MLASEHFWFAQRGAVEVASGGGRDDYPPHRPAKHTPSSPLPRTPYGRPLAR
jgi:hypothetical protein